MTLKILSAGAPKTGVSLCAEAFEKDSGETVEVTFATAPVIKESIGNRTADADLVVAPVNAMDEFMRAGLVLPETVSVVGSVKSAVVVKEGSPEPDLASAETLKAAILAADSLVYNLASSGQYIETMMENLGIADEVLDKTTRTKTGAAVMEHLAASDAANEIGFGQQTEILLHASRGVPVKLVGTLPQKVEKITSYMVGLLDGAAENDAARSLTEFMGSEAGLEIFKSTGVE